jgi:hypothetical protein
MGLDTIAAILERLEQKVDHLAAATERQVQALATSTEKRLDDHERRLRIVEEYKTKALMLAIIAGFVMPLIVLYLNKKF